jgi:hypothetical protein
VGIRWLIGLFAFMIIVPLLAQAGTRFVVAGLLAAVAWTALGAYLDAERFCARTRR